MPSPERSRIAASLVTRAGAGADVHQIADAVVVTWRDIERELTPIIGARGVAALHGRTLFLAGKECPALEGAPSGVMTEMDLEALRSALGTSSSVDALSAGSVMFATFEDLLASMVGAALTERLLRAVWAPHSSGKPAQDSAP